MITEYRPVILGRIQEIFIKKFSHACWTAVTPKDITKMRKYMTNELYSNTVEQLSHYKSINQTDHTECINLLDVQLKGWKKSETYITMIADIKADMIHYITDDNTGEMVSGSNTKPISLHYELSVIRPIGIRSNDRFTRSCPSCGAHIDMRYSGVCTCMNIMS